MEIETIGAAWTAYKQRNLISTIHTNDTMYTTGAKWYWSVGESAIRIISSILMAAPTKKINKLLDFGCGYGRCARHFRAFFPDAELFFCELNNEAAAFCKETFNGHAVDVDNLPNNIDLIWLGSVFTHLDVVRCKLLFDTLVSHLSRAGVIVVTTHGRRAISIHSEVPYISKDKWDDIIVGYKMTGAGYSSYGKPELGDYGVSLMTSNIAISFGMQHQGLRLMTYNEGGWSNHQDVIAWTNWKL